LTAEVLNAHPGRTRPLGSAPVFPFEELQGSDNSALGMQLFRDNCSGCHGSSGEGDGPASTLLSPPPVNFTEHLYRRDLLTEILWNGVYGASMPAWRDLSLEELAALANVVDSFSLVDGSDSSGTLVNAGQSVYEANCAECHGDAGDGNGFAAQNLPIPIMPTDFTRERLSEEAALRALREGIAGTSMAPWGDRLNAQEMTAAAHYVRALYQERIGDD